MVRMGKDAHAEWVFHDPLHPLRIDVEGVHAAGKGLVDGAPSGQARRRRGMPSA